MSEQKKPTPEEIRNIVNEIADYVYSILAELPDEEKWNSAYKFRNGALDLLFFVSQALGNLNPAAAVSEWNLVHKNAQSFREMYLFYARKQKYIEFEPEIVVKTDALLRYAKDLWKESKALDKAENDKDIEHWRKKYRLWKAMGNEDKS